MQKITSGQPLVSVVIPVYNRADIIKDTIGNVLEQTYKNIELIIVDDGSTDATFEILDKLKGERVRFFRQDHLGANAARNLGIEKAKGEYVALLDSADRWDKTKIEKQLNCMQDAPHIDIVFCAEQMKTPDGSFLVPSAEQKKLIAQGRLEEVLARGNCMDTPTIFFRYDSFKKAGPFDADLPRSQDYEWALRAVRKCEIFFLDECLVKSNVRKDSISSDTEKLLYAVPMIFHKHYDLFAQYGTGLDYLMTPVMELYRKRMGYSYFQKYFDILDRNIDVPWRSSVELVYKNTLKLIFSDNVAQQYRIRNMQDGYDIKSLLAKKITFHLFGAGGLAKKLMVYLRSRSMDTLVESVIVTSLENNRHLDDKIPMLAVSGCDEKIKTTPVVLALNNMNMLEVVETLKKSGFERIVTISRDEWNELDNCSDR